jgi:hypothetical protein
MSDSTSTSFNVGFIKVSGDKQVRTSLSEDYAKNVPNIYKALTSQIVDRRGSSNLLAANRVSDASTEIFISTTPTSLKRFALADTGRTDLTYGLTFLGQLPSTSAWTTADAGQLLTYVLKVTHGIYNGLLERCRQIISEIDFDDSEQRKLATERLHDVLHPFSEVIAQAFSGLLGEHRDSPIELAFLLTEVLPHLDHVSDRIRVSIVRTVLDAEKPSTRYAAAQALDNIASPEAKQALVQAFPMEKSKLVRRMIEASLGT